MLTPTAIRRSNRPYANYFAPYAIAFCWLLMTMLHASFAVAADAKPAPQPPLRIAMDVPYHPFAFIDKDTGELTGFDVELAKALCQEMQRECTFVDLPFDAIIPSIEAGKVDIGFAGMAKTEERLKHVIFTDKYYRSSCIFVVPADSPHLKAALSLTGKTVICQSGTIQEDYLKNELKLPQEQIISVETSEEVFAGMKNKKADMAFIDGVSGYYYLSTEEGSFLEIIGEPVIMPENGSGYIVLHPSLTSVRDAFNAALATLLKNGVYHAINRRYFSFNIY